MVCQKNLKLLLGEDKTWDLLSPHMITTQKSIQKDGQEFIKKFLGVL